MVRDGRAGATEPGIRVLQGEQGNVMGEQGNVMGDQGNVMRVRAGY